MFPVVMTVKDICDQQHVGRHRVYKWANREDDPLPLRRMRGTERSSFVLVSEWVEWMKRNSDLCKEDGHEGEGGAARAATKRRQASNSQVGR